jgi:hypothetical protein
MVEFALNSYYDPNVPSDIYDDWDDYIAKLATAMAEELESYPQNEYLSHYVNLLYERANG